MATRSPGAPSAPGHPLVIVALASLAAGAAYYALLRGAGPPPVVDPTHGTFPSLVHGFATALLLLAAAARHRRRTALALGANLVLTITLECTLGTFDPLDLAALALGTLGALALARAPGVAARDGAARIAVPGLLLVSGALTAGSVGLGAALDGDGGSGDDAFAGGSGGEPVYLSYAALRDSVAVGEPRALADIGRLYLYEDLLLLNARNEGVHVIDNTDPANPVPLSFVEIPGNTELAIRSGILYADSYVDLVAIDLETLGPEVQIVREPDVFPWDPRQNVPDEAFFLTSPDEALGVVVGIDVGGTVLVDLPGAGRARR